MDSSIKRLEKQVREVKREISGLNERFGGFEQTLSTVKDLTMEIKEALAVREARGKSPMVQSLKKDSPVQMETSRRSSMSKTVSKPKEMGGTSGKNGGVKKMTHAELFFRIENRVCLLCDEDDTEGHDCKNKHLPLIFVDDDDELFDDEEEGEKDEEEEETDEDDEDESVMGKVQNSLTMNSTVSNNLALFKFLGKIGSRKVIVKIGSGATHNFISKKLVAELQLPVKRTKRFRVNCGVLPKAEGTGVCDNVLLKAQGIEIVARFFPTELGVADVVLGSEWLTSVGIYSFQGSPPTMTFEWHGRTVTLRSDPSLTKGIEMGLMILEWD